MVRVAAGRISVAPSTEPGYYDVRATQHVGSIVSGDLTVHVRPKIQVDTILHLLGAAPERIKWWRERFGYQAYPDLLPALAAFYGRVVEDALRRGLVRAYRQEHERTRAIRGRIDFAELVRRPEMQTPSPCTYDDFTADVDLNRFLKAGLRAALRLPGSDRLTRRVLSRELMRFDEVADAAVSAELLDRHTYTRLDRHYEPAVHLARVLLAHQSLADTSGRVGANAFMVDMNKLFETFVERRLRDLLRGQIEVSGQHASHLDVDKAVGIQPDLLLHQGRRVRYVADVKYKLNQSGLGLAPDYYQALAYATALDLPEAVLIYCHDDGTVPPVEVTVRGSGKRLLTYRLSLSGSHREIDQAMQGLAAFLGTRALDGRLSA